MSLPCCVRTEETGIVGEDDGRSAWYRTVVNLMVSGLIVQAQVLTDAYSGRLALSIVRDDIGMDPPVAKVLLREAYHVNSEQMIAYSSGITEAFFDLERLISRLFYRSQASALIRRIATA